MLKGLGMGDAASDELPANLLAAVGLDAGQMTKVLERMVESRDELDTMARQLVA
jgi:hypothetical protein